MKKSGVHMQHVTVVGAGFSGLVTAHYLTKMGIPVRIFEKGDRAGGLISTKKYSEGLAETAANAIMNTKRVEELFEDLELKTIRTRKTSRARFIFRGRPRRWPLGVLETMGMIVRVLVCLFTGPSKLRPKDLETIREYGLRVLGPAATEFLLAPALQGIYAGDISKMSARLIFSRRFRPGSEKGEFRGMVSPEGGMGELIEALKTNLEKKGVVTEYGKKYVHKEDVEESVVICTSAYGASNVLRITSPRVSEILSRVDIVPVVTVTNFYPAEESTMQGFGCLFPRNQNFRVLGILFNDCIFEGRTRGAHSETWIFGGGTDRSITGLNEEELQSVIERERRIFYGRSVRPLNSMIQYWPEGLPHYDVALERILSDGLDLPKGIHLVGNYLGGIGLSRILERAFQTAKDITFQREVGRH